MSAEFTLHVDPHGGVLASARDCEQRVFADTYGNTSAEWDEEYGPYEAASAFLAVTDATGEAVGALRLITPSSVGLKTLVDVGRPPWFIDGVRSAYAAGMDPAQTWDVATLAMSRGVRGGAMVAAALYHGLFHAARTNDIRWIVMILDARVRRLLNAAGIGTSVLPGTRPGPYLGSDSSVPLWGDLPRMADRQRRTNPDAYRLINLGIGLSGIHVPPPAAFLLTERDRVHEGVFPGADQARPPEPTPGVSSSRDDRTNATTSPGGRGRDR